MALAGIPFAAGGGVLALYLTGLNFSVSAAVGFISLFGVSVMNGILIMTYYNETRASGMGTMDAMFHAASQRMRPMLMTALSACIGLLPAAVSTGIGSQVQRPLATVVVGGMFIGPIILLVVVAGRAYIVSWVRGVDSSGLASHERRSLLSERDVCEQSRENWLSVFCDHVAHPVARGSPLRRIPQPVGARAARSSDAAAAPSGSEASSSADAVSKFCSEERRRH